MKKFLNLLKKEIKELVNVQLVVSLAFTLLLFNFVGQMSRKEVQKAIGVQPISALDLDGSASSQAILAGLESARFKIERIEGKTKEQAIDIARGGESKLLLVIPSGFGDSLKDLKPSQIETYSYMRSFSLIGARGSAIVRGVISALNNVLSDSFLKEKLPGLDPASLKNPIKSKDFVIVQKRMAEASASDVAGMVSSQSLLIPVVLMMIVIYSSQMVISAVAMEKQNKTLETLLTVPIRRTSIITAKMLAAGLVGLLSAGIYMFGFKSFMGGIGGDDLQAAASQGGAVMRQLGLYFDTSGYLILGASLFLAILVALALAMILGVLAEDFRSAQSMLMPLMFMVMIPYFISLFADINTVSLPIKIFILAIPFSHPFLVSQNLYLGNYGMIFGGLAYMLVVFTVLVVFAARIFSTDRILTMKLRFGKKRGATA
ncbi:MAG: ABC transporter permease [Acidobacteria bacterium]|nr:ABC transporter permease [Acidobacteriota bacterium]MBE3129930.1 ABC transporter permease [Acidobacteriota bacterium]